MYRIMACTYMKTHARAHTHTLAGARSYMHTQRDLSAADTFNIEARPSLHSVFTCKCSTTICGPSRLLCPCSRLGLGNRAASQMGTTSDGLQWLWSQTLRREEKREGRGCLPGSHRNSRDSHI